MIRAFLLIAVVGIACDRGDRGSSPPSPPDLQIVSAGNEPRRTLRYRLPKGAKQGLEVAIDLDLEAGEVGGPLPTLAISMMVAVEDVLPDERMKLHVTIVDVAARDRPESKVPANALTGPLDAMKGVALTALLSPTGRLGKAELEGGKQLPQAVNEQLSALITSFEHTMMSLPDAPVGPGAVWRNSRVIDQNGMKLTAVNSVALTTITGDKVSYTVDTSIHADDQKVEQGGLTVDVKDITGTGTGKGEFELTSLKLTSELDTEFRSEMLTPGDEKPTSMRMKTSTTVTPR